MKKRKLTRRISMLLVVLLGATALMHKYWPEQWVAYLQGPGILHVQSDLIYTFNTLKHPTGLAITPATLFSSTPGPGTLLISDTDNHVIRWFDLSGSRPLGTLAGQEGVGGYVNGDAATARFSNPTGLATRTIITCIPGIGCINSGVEFLVNDSLNYVVRKIGINSGSTGFAVSTVCGSHNKGWVDGPSGSASFAALGGITNTGSTYYIVDSENHCVRMWDGHNVSTLAGNGSYGFSDGYRTNARFDVPGKIARDGSGNLYVADIGNNAIRKIDTSGNVSLCAGRGPTQPGLVDGYGANACFNRPTSIVWNPSDNMMYVADSLNNCIRRMDMSGNVTTYAGATDGTPGLVNGPLLQARFGNPTDIAIHNRFMYISDTNNNAIRIIDMNTGIVSTYLN
jgi:hypothetical protein